MEHDEQRLTNLGGTFTFGSVVDSTGAVVATPFERYVRTVGGVPGYRPSFFSIARGAPEIRFSDWYTSWFVQDDWRMAPELTLSLGLRHDMQEQARSQLNFAPRADWHGRRRATFVISFASRAASSTSAFRPT